MALHYALRTAVICFLSSALLAQKVSDLSSTPTVPEQALISVAVPSGSGYTTKSVAASNFVGSLEPDFTIALLPDTQSLIVYNSNILASQTSWLYSNRAALNLKLVIGLGDVVDTETAVQWQSASNCYNWLVTNSVPTLVGIGNHDYDGSVGGAVPARDSTAFNLRFGTNIYLGKPWVGGFFDSSKGENMYAVITNGASTYVFIQLEFGPRTNVMDWAAGVITNNPKAKVFIATHCYMYGDDTRVDLKDTYNPHDTGHGYATTDGATGDDMWNYLVRKYPNIVGVFSGHQLLSGKGRLYSAGDNGNIVSQFLFNYQYGVFSTNFPAGPRWPEGYMQLLRFRPGAGLVEVRTWSPWLQEYRTEPGFQFGFPLGARRASFAQELQAGPSDYSLTRPYYGLREENADGSFNNLWSIGRDDSTNGGALRITFGFRDAPTSNAAAVVTISTGGVVTASGGFAGVSTNTSSSGSGYSALDDGLLLHLPLTERSGTNYLDRSGLGHHAVAYKQTNGPPGSLPIPGNPGLEGYAARFTNGFLYVTNSADLSGLSNITVSAWAWIDTGYSQTNAILVGKHNQSTDGEFYLSVVDRGGTNALSIAVITGSGRVDYDAPTFFAAGESATNGWHHYAFTYDGTTARTFVDGIGTGSAPQTGVLNTTVHPITVGEYPGAGVYGNTAKRQTYGLIDEVRVWNRALATNELHTLFRRDVGTKIIAQRVGIGTNAPAQALDVIGNVLVHGVQTNGGSMWVDQNNVYNFGSTSMHYSGLFGENVTANNTVQGAIISAVNGTNMLLWGGTNPAPTINASTPVVWVSVRISGKTNAYRMPLYE